MEQLVRWAMEAFFITFFCGLTVVALTFAARAIISLIRNDP